jgi:hypothetical protein
MKIFLKAGRNHSSRYLVTKLVIKITEVGGLTNSILKIIWFVSVFNILYLGLFYEEHMKGEQLLSDYIDSSKNVSDNVMLTENKIVTIILETKEPCLNSELLKIVVVDPQNREYSWGKNFSGFTLSGSHGTTTVRNKDYFSFMPKVSGMHHVKISNAYFQTYIELVSGMVNPYEQPFFVITLFVSFLIMVTGLFSSMNRKTIDSIKLESLSVNGILHFSLAIFIGLIIVHIVISHTLSY